MTSASPMLACGARSRWHTLARDRDLGLLSGSFIDALSRPSHHRADRGGEDRTSFGCSDDRHLTYFGEGFYRDALPAALSLREAFEATRTEIGEARKAGTRATLTTRRPGSAH